MAIKKQAKENTEQLNPLGVFKYWINKADVISLKKNLDIYFGSRSGSHFGSQTETNYIKYIVTEREISIEKTIDLRIYRDMIN